MTSHCRNAGKKAKASGVFRHDYRKVQVRNGGEQSCSAQDWL